ncbi:OsmC family protein [Nakamurella sp. GG22]
MTVDIGDASAGAARTDGLWVERVGTRRYVGHNARGARVEVGPADAGGVFTPGELLKIALAGCAGMSADSAVARRLGPDVAITVHVAGIKHADDERYPALHEEIVVDLSSLDAAERDRVVTVVRRAVDRNCTVGRTLERGADVALNILDQSVHRPDDAGTGDAGTGDEARSGLVPAAG